MTDLIAKSPFEGLLPVSVGSVEMGELDLGHLTIIAPFKGCDDAVSDVLSRQHGLSLPAANRTAGKAGCRAIWFARGQVMLSGPAPHPELAQHAALIDQSDAWASVELRGDAAEDVLARLAPVDLRAATFKRGHTLRTLLSHMSASITRTGAQRFQILVFRSMAATLVHEVKTAMEGVAARG